MPLLYNGTRKLPDTFDNEEIERILHFAISSEKYLKSEWGQWMKYRDVCLFATIYVLGLRPKEACCLRFENFDLKRTTVKIKGTSNKNRKDRVIPVPKILFKFYEKYFGFSRLRFWKGSPYVFPSFQNRHISPKRAEQTFREKILKPLQLWNGNNSLYTLRHSRASHILNKQIRDKGSPDLLSIANFLGHSDIRSTKVYLHTGEEYIEYMREQVDL